MTKAMTFRLDDDDAATAEVVARVEGTSLNQLVRNALTAYIAARRQDPKFRADLEEIIKRDQAILDRLA